MKIITTLMVLLLSVNSYAGNKKEVKRICDDIGGEIVKKVNCPSRKGFFWGNYCVVKNKKNQMAYFNGCTGAKGKYGLLFFDSCVDHDFCYHHEPISNGFTKKQCDDRFLDDLKSVCDENREFKNCLRVAKFFHFFVSKFGKSSYTCSNTKFN